jgi:hypothetical protein
MNNDPIIEKIEKEEKLLNEQIESQENNITQTCAKCKKILPLKDFGLTKDGKKYYSRCILCREGKEAIVNSISKETIPDIIKTSDVTKKVIDELSKIEKTNIEEIKKKIMDFDKSITKEVLDKLTDEEVIKKRNEIFTSKIVDAFGDTVPDSPEDFMFVLTKTVTGILEQLPQLKEKGIILDGWSDSIEKNRRMNLALLRSMLKKNPQLMTEMLSPELMFGISIIGSGVSIAAMNNNAKKNDTQKK